MIRSKAICALLCACIIFTGVCFAHDSILDQVDDSRPVHHLNQFFRVLYSFEMFEYDIAVGLSLRPDLYHDLYGDGSVKLIDPKLWFEPAEYLGTIGLPIEEAVYELMDTPRVFSISIKF